MRIVTSSLLQEFQEHLELDEKSLATIEKYMRDLQGFAQYMGDTPLDKAKLLCYKQQLEEKYAYTSANSILVAINAFLKFVGWNDLCVKRFKIQKKIYCSEEKELTKNDYRQLIDIAEKEGKKRISLVIQTICATGIRVSELQSITVEAVKKGEATVFCKGKNRVVFLVSKLRKKLLQYAKQKRIESGMIFVTRTGKALDRSNIWREMKALCEKAGVKEEKVFPHNLRHLFARTFYGKEKDIAKLADILGHTNVNTTRIYIITTGVEHKNQLEALELVQ